MHVHLLFFTHILCYCRYSGELLAWREHYKLSVETKMDAMVTWYTEI